MKKIYSTLGCKSIFMALALGAFAMPVMAQGLHKDIEVQREIVADKRDAARFTVLPQLQLAPLAKPDLAFSDRVVTSSVPNTFRTLAPLAWGDKLYISPYRGYVGLGIGAPVLNTMVSAGYRAIDNDKTRLSLWTQYDGSVYHRDYPGQWLPVAPTQHSSDQVATIGVDIHQAVGKESFIDGGLDYTYGYNKIPYKGINFAYIGQNISRMGAQAFFTSREGGFNYTAGLRYRHFGYYHGSHNPGFCGAIQNNIGGDLRTRFIMDGESSVGLDAEADFLRTCKSLTLDNGFSYLAIGAKNRARIALHPYYAYMTPHFKARVGAEVDIRIKSGKTFHIAPEASFAWTPTQIFGFEVKAQGGDRLNTLASMYEVSPYMSPYMSYGFSNIPIDVVGRLSFGPFAGASLQVFGGYAKANDWLMPMRASSWAPAMPDVFAPFDLSAWHGGVELGYQYRGFADFTARWETASNNTEHSYYMWRDRAKHVIDLKLNLKPIQKLSVDLGWQMRFKRHTTRVTRTDVAQIGTIYGFHPESMGAMSNLSVGASYEVTDALTVFGRGENLLNRNYEVSGIRLAEPAYGMVGFGLKF